nr:MAG TPA: Putative stress-responsive nuclear envelope protein [Caudoviricetes sp.]
MRKLVTSLLCPNTPPASGGVSPLAVPTASSTKADIMAYLDSKGITYSASQTKEQLLALIGA